jgi:membrane-associated phospholipid phosphatase
LKRVTLRPRTLLLAAAACVAAFLGLLALAYWGGSARWLDTTALRGFLGLQSSALHPVAGLGDAPPVGVAACALAVFALVRGRPRSGALVIALLALTSVSSQLLKALFAYPRPEGDTGLSYIAPEAFPSGHATAVMSLAIALVFVVPARLRPLAALVGAGFALSVSFSIVALGWHFPSDVAGGFLLASFWALVLLAGLRGAEARWPQRSVRGRLADAGRAAADRAAALGLGVVAVSGGLLLLVAATTVVVLRGGDVLAYANDHTAMLAVAAALMLSALGLLAVLAVAATRRS